MVSTEELKKIMESYVKKHTFLHDDDWKKFQERHRGPHLAEVTRDDVIQILNRYLAGEYPAEDVDIWADGILQYYFNGYIDMLRHPDSPLFPIIESLAISAEEDLTPEDARAYILRLQG